MEDGKEKILIVEDSETHFRMVKDALDQSKDNYDIERAETGPEGLEKIVKGCYDLVLLDFELPEMNGLEILERVNEGGVEVPIVMLTGVGSEKVAVDALKKGASDYVRKTFDSLEAIPIIVKENIKKFELKKEREEFQRRIKESEERYRTLVERSSDCICLLDLDGKIIHMNNGGVMLNELDGLEDAIGVYWSKMVKKEYEGLLEESLKKAREGEVVNFQYESVTPKGCNKWWESVVSPIKDHKGKVVNLIKISRDITERKKAEEKLVEYARQLERSNQLKDLFMDIMRHDLLNPTGVIRTTSMLAMEEDSLGDIREELKVIDKSAERIEGMVENASKLAKIESAEEFELEEVDLNEIWGRVIEGLKPMLDEKGMEVEYKRKEQCLAEVNSVIEDVFSNLLSNAIKYSPEGS
ncbi:MAG: response regulator, partial [Candidatus Hydrothermarchaeales archaeon]